MSAGTRTSWRRPTPRSSPSRPALRRVRPPPGNRGRGPRAAAPAGGDLKAVLHGGASQPVSHITADDGARIRFRLEGREGRPVVLPSNSLGTALDMWTSGVVSCATTTSARPAEPYRQEGNHVRYPRPVDRPRVPPRHRHHQRRARSSRHPGSIPSDRAAFTGVPPHRARFHGAVSPGGNAAGHGRRLQTTSRPAPSSCSTMAAARMRASGAIS